MISKQKLKYINSLQIKKNRQEQQLFLVEGTKNVLELIDSTYEITDLIVTPTFYEQNIAKINHLKPEIIEQAEIEKIGSLQSNNAALAVVKMKNNRYLTCNENEYILVLDEVKDPGNLGTIIRIADWYGIHKIICSNTCVDAYNSKVISATMGSFTRVSLYYCDLLTYFNDISNKAILGAFLEGENIHHFVFPKAGYIVLGNESRGISQSIEACINSKITIKKFGDAESLNVGIATAIILDNIKRQASV